MWHERWENTGGLQNSLHYISNEHTHISGFPSEPIVINAKLT